MFDCRIVNLQIDFTFSGTRKRAMATLVTIDEVPRWPRQIFPTWILATGTPFWASLYIDTKLVAQARASFVSFQTLEIVSDCFPVELDISPKEFKPQIVLTA